MTKMVQKAQQKLDDNVQSLYTTFGPTGETIPANSEEIHQQKLDDFEAEYYATLRGIMADAAERKAEALDVLSRTNAVAFNWLDDAELDRVNAMYSIVKDDLQAFGDNLRGLIQYIGNAASSGDTALQWLILRSAGDIWDNSGSEEAYNPVVANDYNQAIEGLRQAVTPTHLLAEEATAKQTLAAADADYSEAQYLLPEYRQELAVNLGIDAQYLPEELPTAAPAMAEA